MRGVDRVMRCSAALFLFTVVSPDNRHSNTAGVVPGTSLLELSRQITLRRNSLAHQSETLEEIMKTPSLDADVRFMEALY